jgi:hypothetical protein
VKSAMAVERHFALLCRDKTILFSGLVWGCNESNRGNDVGRCRR